MGTSALYIERVEAAFVKGEYHILAEDGTVCTYDPVAGYFYKLRDPKFYTARTKRAVNSGGAL